MTAVPQGVSQGSERQSTGSGLVERPRRIGLVRDTNTTATYPGKRLLDCVLAGGILLATAPLLLVCAILVRLASRGPVLFGHRRIGQGGKPFDCLKFRSMVVGAEDLLNQNEDLRSEHRKNGFKLPTEADPRVTRVGAVLRRTHLDELPQLINVLRGEMSLVGPRPIVEKELDLYGEGADELLSARPGVFGCWTALGRRRPGYPERCEVELEYVRQASMKEDVTLLARNLLVVLKGQ